MKTVSRLFRRASTKAVTKAATRVSVGALGAALLLGLSGCSGMTERERSTAIGAGVGAVGGAVLTGGDTAGTLGGAAVGGVLGHEYGKRK